MSATRLHRIRTADGVRLSLHRLRPAIQRYGTPVLLVPGTFSTRAFWLGTRGHGFGRTLADAGFDTWILEPRGHGASERPSRWTMSDWIRWDAPAAVRGVLDATGAEGCFWMGHSAGGVVGAAFAGSSDPEARRLRGLVLIGAPGPAAMGGWRGWVARGSRLVATLAPTAKIPGSLLGLGPEPEPAPLVREWMRWNLAGGWRDPRGHDYLAELGRVDLPLLAVGGTGDHGLAPPAAVRDLAGRFASRDRTLVIAGRSTGFRADYGHAGLVVSRPAREELWPLFLNWLRDRADGAVAGPLIHNSGDRHEPARSARQGAGTQGAAAPDSL